MNFRIIRQLVYGAVLITNALVLGVALGILILQIMEQPAAWFLPHPVAAAEEIALSHLTLPATSTPFQPLAVTLTPTQTSTATAAPTASPTTTATALPTNTPLPIVDDGFQPGSAFVSGVVGYPQQFTLDCESRSAVDLAAFFSIHIDQMDFQANLPLSDDPEEGFVGSYRGAQGQLPPNSYGVHAPPVAALLRSYGLNASAAKGLSWDDLRAEIASGRPVMVWVIHYTYPGTPVLYTASNGNTTTVARFEHTAILVGYTPTEVTLVDGGMTYRRTVDQFLESWGVLGNMAITVADQAALD